MNAYLKYLILFIFLGAVVPGKAQEYGRGSKAKATAAATTTKHTKALVIGTMVGLLAIERVVSSSD